jgi:fatty-acyl-CoA synthase
MTTTPHRPLTWIHQIRRHATMKPGVAAVRFRGNGITWAELGDRVDRVSNLLLAEDVRPGDRVAILMTNRAEYVEAVVGINLLGAIAVPVNFRLTAREIAYILSNSGAKVVLSEVALAATAEEAIRSAPDVQAHLVVGGGEIGDHWRDYERALQGAPNAALEWPVGVDDTALIMYTSGTTGSPKGAMLSYSNLIAQSLTMTQVFELVGEDEISLVTSPLFHIAALGSLLPSLIFGHTTVLTPTGSFDAEAFLDLAETECVTTSFLVPTQWQAICDSPTIERRTMSLKSIAWGAAPATPALLRRLSEVFPAVKIVSTFGQTEMSPNTTVLRGADAVRKIGSVGKPLLHVEVRVVDSAMDDVEQGEIGEIVYRGAGVMQGYWDRPEETAAAFHGGWFHSGDLVRVDDDGFFYVVDRLKDMIISGGENIYCAEVEAVIADDPRVRDVALVGTPHEKWGETPVAFIVATDPGNPPTEDEIVLLSQERLASYKKPSRVIVLEDMPRNASGKILKEPLRKIAATN